MSYIKVTTTYPTGGTLLPNTFIDRFMINANGDYVKVYIYLLRMVSEGANFSIPCLADVLELTERDVTRALKYWQKQSLLHLKIFENEISSIELLPISGTPKLPEGAVASNQTAPAKEHKATTAVPAMKSLSPSQLSDKSKDEQFSYLLYICEMYLGKPLTCTDMNMLLYFYEDLSMPTDLIEYLVEHCISNGKKNFRYMQTIAISWYEEGIKTVDAAKAQSSQYKKEYYTIMKAFGLNQNLAPVQEEFIKKWLDIECFDLDLIIEACNRTIKAINKPSFPYADTILKKWKENNIHSVTEAKAFSDQQRVIPTTSVDTRAPKHNFTQREYDFDQLDQKLLQKQFAKITKEK